MKASKDCSGVVSIAAYIVGERGSLRIRWVPIHKGIELRTDAENAILWNFKVLNEIDITNQ